MIDSLTVERRLQICLAAVAALGTLLLGLGQSNLTLPVIAVFAAVTSVWFTDCLGWFKLHRHAANVLALGAVGFAVMDFLEQDAGRQLIAIANLLIYMQIILFYQEKHLRVYWHLLVLSLLQVVVSAALNLGVEFGVLLIVYMFLALVTLTMLFILSETAEYTVDSHGSSFGLSPSPAPTPIRRLHGTLDPASTHQAPAFTAVLSTDEPAEAMLTRGLIWQVIKLGLTTLALTFFVFFLTPRFGESNWRGGQAGTEQLVGFSQEVRLNDIGRILESPEKVMRVQYVTNDDNRPYELRGELYLRGSVLADYEPKKGHWEAVKPRSLYEGPLPEPTPRQTGIVRQSIALEDSIILFSTMPVCQIDETPGNLRLSAEIGQILRFPQEVKGFTGHLRYDVGTTAFANGLQRDIIPRHFGAETSWRRSDEDPWRVSRYLRFEAIEESLPSVRGISEAILRDAELEPSNRIGQARALEAHLQRVDVFRYTLELTGLPPDHMDPIEHFLTTSHRGHCEYFASALTLMLRSQGIPARMVVGFKGGDYNRVGHYYQIRQLHAHAWVEAFLEPQHIPDGALLDHETPADGAWLRLDPTPLDIEPLMAFPGASILDRFGQCTEYMQALWNDYILGMDTKRQREAIYKPLMDRTVTTFTGRAWQFVFFWVALWSELIQRLGMDSLAHFYQRWFNWNAVPVVIGLVLLMVAGYLVLRRPVQRAWGWFWVRLKTKVLGRFLRSRETDFYYRFEKLLRRYGLRRQRGQTPRELAMATAQWVPLGSDASTAGMLDVHQAAQDIVDLFYRVRYGGRPLDAAESVLVEQKLGHVERQFKAAKKRNRAASS